MYKVTMHDVAKKSGFGIGTVSRVVTGDKSVKESTRQKVLQVIEELHYVPNVNGARLRRKHSGVIAVLVPVINHPYFAKFVECVESEASKNGYSLLLVASQMDETKEKEILKKIYQREVDGAIFVTHYEHSDEELEGLPLVSIDRYLNHSIPFVSSDNYEATKKAIELFISHGDKRIGYVGTKPLVESEVFQRERAYLDVIYEHHLEPIIMNEIVRHGDEEKLVEKFLEKNKDLDAIFASGSTLSQLLYFSLMKRKAGIPEKIELISYDGIFLNRGDKRIVSSIEQPLEEMAKASFKLLIDIINGNPVNQKNIFKTKFVKGTTTRQRRNYL